ncbi:MAG TPA: rhodanese-like domain-containing protein [Anaeromyxobacter sp.]
MKKIVVALACLAFTLPAAAQDVGDYGAQIAAGAPLEIPPGIYAATANRLAAFYVGIFDPAKARTVFADALLARIEAGQKPFIVDIRPAKDYAAGHVPGAISIPLDVLFLAENLALLPTDGTPIILVCHTGHTASMAMGGLAALGYNPYVLRFSMMAWSARSNQKIFTGSQTQEIFGLGGPLER